MIDIFTDSNTKSKSSGKKRAAASFPPQGNAFSAFQVQPSDVRFETQAEEEEIILFLRQHIFTTFGWITVSIVLLLLPSFVIPLIMNSNFIPADLPGGYFIVLPLLWYVGTFGYILMNFLYWYFNIYIVTNQRIVDVDWVNLLYKQFSSTGLEKIQDVNFRQAGIFDLFFDYGDVHIQTAGKEQNFEFASVPRPDDVVSQINDLLKKREQTEDI